MSGGSCAVRRRVAAWPWLLLAGLAVSAISGCADGYPDDLKYPLRTDLLSLEGRGENNDLTPPGIDSPGPKGWSALLDTYRSSAKGKKNILDPHDLSGKLRSDLDTLLNEYFGTPAKPKVKTVGDDDAEKAEALKLDADTLAAGSKLYRRQCLHCHGVSGDGRGPTGYWINPHPRDYRSGIFKFMSSKAGGIMTRRPRRADLVRVMRQGIDGSAMPAFELLSQDELEQLASYVIHLSMRGEMEFAVLQAALTATPSPKSGADFTSSDRTLDEEASSLSEYFKLKQPFILKIWAQSQKDPMSPKPDYEKYLKSRRENAAMTEDKVHAQNVRKGFTYFQTVGCLACHLDYGRKRNYKWEVWGTVTRAADLTLGIYRGGRRPIDIYYRIRGGIDSCGMPAVEDTILSTEEQNSPNRLELIDERIWDLVEFVIALPYPAMLDNAGIKDKIYPGD